MHESAKSRELFAVIMEQAKANKLKKITRLVFRVGEASGVTRKLLVHSFVDHLLPGTIGEGAVIEVIMEGVEARCSGCGKKVSFEDDFHMYCAECSSYDFEIVGGRDVLVDRMEGI